MKQDHMVDSSIIAIMFISIILSKPGKGMFNSVGRRVAEGHYRNCRIEHLAINTSFEGG